MAQAATINQSPLPGLAGIWLMAGLVACGLGLTACGLGLRACGLGLRACGLGETDGPRVVAVADEDTDIVGWGEDAAGA